MAKNKKGNAESVSSDASASENIQGFDENVKRKNAYTIPPHEIIVPDDFNIRIDYGDIEALASDIRHAGLITPLVLMKRDDGRYELRDGFRRMRAIVLNREKYDFDMQRVDFILEPSRTTASQQIANIFRRNSGKELNFFEMAEGCKRLQNLGLSNKEIALEICRSESEVSNLLMLSTKTETKVLNFISDNIEAFAKSKSAIFETLRAHTDPKEQLESLKNAIESVSDGERVTANTIRQSREKVTGEKVVSPMKKLRDLAVKGHTFYAKNKNFIILQEIVAVLLKEKSFEEMCDEFGIDLEALND